jgi:hypothetical protein
MQCIVEHVSMLTHRYNNRGTYGNGLLYLVILRVIVSTFNMRMQRYKCRAPCGGGLEYLHRNLRVVRGDEKGTQSQMKQ